MMGTIKPMVFLIAVMTVGCSAPTKVGTADRQVASFENPYLCSKVDPTVYMGDFTVEEICLNASKAIVQVGRSEVSKYAYTITRTSLGDTLILTPKSGLAINKRYDEMTLKLMGNFKSYDFMEYLRSSGAGVTFQKGPTSYSGEGKFVASKFVSPP